MLSHSVMSGSAIPWTVARQAGILQGFSRQEYWRGLPCPPPRGPLPARLGFSMGFSRQEYWRGLPFPPPRGSSQLWDQTHISYICQHWEAGSLPLALPISSYRLILFIQPVGACYITQGAQLGALRWPRVVGWG